MCSKVEEEGDGWETRVEERERERRKEGVDGGGGMTRELSFVLLIPDRHRCSHFPIGPSMGLGPFNGLKLEKTNTETSNTYHQDDVYGILNFTCGMRTGEHIPHNMWRLDPRFAAPPTVACNSMLILIPGLYFNILFNFFSIALRTFEMPITKIRKSHTVICVPFLQIFTLASQKVHVFTISKFYSGYRRRK